MYRQAPGITNQGNTNYCAVHAVGKAVVEAARRQRVDFRVDLNDPYLHKHVDRRKGVINILIKKLEECRDNNLGRCRTHLPNDGVWPTWFDGQRFKMHDRTTHQYYYVEIDCKEVKYYSHDGVFAIVYGGPNNGHAVFVRREERHDYVCMNSWGPYENNEEGHRYGCDEAGQEETWIPKNTVDHIYRVQVKLTPSPHA